MIMMEWRVEGGSGWVSWQEQLERARAPAPKARRLAGLQGLAQQLRNLWDTIGVAAEACPGEKTSIEKWCYEAG